MVSDGEADNVETAFRVQPALADAVLHELADDVQLSLEGGRHHPAPRDVNLAKHGDALPRQPAHLALVDGDVAPANDALVLLLGHFLEDGLARRARCGVLRKEDLPHAVATAAGHLEAQAEALPLEEAVRELQENARPVGRLGVSPARGAVTQVVQNGERVFHDGARLLATDVDHKADTAGVMLS